jgi:endonuclease IV
MNKTITIAAMAVIMIGGIRAAKANLAAINEMQAELTNLSEKHSDAKINLKRAKSETSNLGSAVSTLKKSIKLALKSDSKKQKAMQASIDSVGYSHKRNPYLADMSHLQPVARLSDNEINKGSHY